MTVDATHTVHTLRSGQQAAWDKFLKNNTCKIANAVDFFFFLEEFNV